MPEGLVRAFKAPPLGEIDSCTGCELATYLSPARAIGGLLVPFYNDSQSCVTWAVWLGPDGGHAVLSFHLAGRRGEDTDGMVADEPIQWRGRRGVVRETRAIELRFVAPSVSVFLHRVWLENQLWFALNPSADWPSPPLTSEMEAYLDWYRRRNSTS